MHAHTHTYIIVASTRQVSMSAASRMLKCLMLATILFESFQEVFKPQVCNTTKNVLSTAIDGYNVAVCFEKTGCSFFQSSVRALDQYCFSSVTVFGPAEPLNAWVDVS